MPTKNKDIPDIADAPKFKRKVKGCCVAKAHEISLDNAPTVPMSSWAANMLNEMYKKRSALVASAAQLVAKSEMDASPAKDSNDIIDLPETQITAHLDTHIAFLADNQPS